MNKSNKVFLLFLITICIKANAANYDKCQKALVNLPFNMNVDGKLTPKKNTNYKSTSDKKLEEFEYEATGQYQQLEKRKVKVIRDHSGRISRIIELNPNFTTKEIKGKYAFLTEYGKNPEVEFILNKSKTTTLNYADDNECFVSDQFMEYIVKPEIGADTIKSYVFSTKLCHDLYEFIRNNKDARACFDKGLNEKLSKVLNGYKNPTFHDKNFSHIGKGLSFDNPFSDSSGRSISSDEGQPLNSLPRLEYLLRDEINPQIGTSPIIRSHIILENCNNHGLKRFYMDNKFWKTTEIKSNGAIDKKSSVTKQ